MSKLQKLFRDARAHTTSTTAKLGAGLTAMSASALALAAGSGPGDAIAGELATGRAQQMVVIGAVAVLLGVLIVWAYIKRAK